MRKVIKSKSGVEFEVIKSDKKRNIAILLQVSHRMQCVKHGGGEYAFVLGKHSKKFLHKEVAERMFVEYQAIQEV